MENKIRKLDSHAKNVQELKQGFLKYRTDAIEIAYSVLLDLYHPATPLPQGPRAYTLEEVREGIIAARNSRLTKQESQFEGTNEDYNRTIMEHEL